MSERPRNPLRFPARRHVLTTSLKVTEIPTLVVALRREVAEVLRQQAGEESAPVARRLLEIADMFDERGRLAPPPPKPHDVVPLKRAR